MKYIVYVLHFDTPVFGKGHKVPFQHYIGYTKDLHARLKKHRNGNGSMWVAWMMKNGATFKVVHTEEYEDKPEARARELHIKKCGGQKRLCPICTPKKKEARHDH